MITTSSLDIISFASLTSMRVKGSLGSFLAMKEKPPCHPGAGEIRHLRSELFPYLF